MQAVSPCEVYRLDTDRFALITFRLEDGKREKFTGKIADHFSKLWQVGSESLMLDVKIGVLCLSDDAAEPAALEKLFESDAVPGDIG